VSGCYTADIYLLGGQLNIAGNINIRGGQANTCGDKMTAIKQLNDFQLPHVNNRKAYAFVKVLLYCRFT